jgi:hypothetical protein
MKSASLPHFLIDREKILDAATACLFEAADAGSQFQAVRDFISRLRDKPGWTDDEVIAVQAEVIRILLTTLKSGR